MKTLFAAVLALLLAVPSFAEPLSGKAASGAFFAAGTLADANDPVQMALAPEYTRLAVVRQRMTALLDKLSASPEVEADRLRGAIFSANAVNRLADSARDKLNVLAASKADDAAFRSALGEARELIRRAETLHDNLKKGN